MKFLGTIIFSLVLPFSIVMAADNCTAAKKQAVCNESIVKEKVKWACDLIKKDGKKAVDVIAADRFDCCGETDYVWINDMHPTMIMHPIKSKLDGTDLSAITDENGKKLFVEFVNAVKKSPAGAWVEYNWKKSGEAKGTPKTSWVVDCQVGNTAEHWVVGSGTWK